MRVRFLGSIISHTLDYRISPGFGYTRCGRLGYLAKPKTDSRSCRRCRRRRPENRMDWGHL